MMVELNGMGCTVVMCVVMLMNIQIWLVGSSPISEEVTPECDPSMSFCQVVWNLTRVETMMIYTADGTAYPVFFRDGTFQKRLRCEASSDQPMYEDITETEYQSLNLLNGKQKLVYAVNGKSPGGTLVIYENQTVEIVVYNNFIQESTGIHWHGMFQHGTPWMDGVTSVTQCPINLQETFSYRFKPEPSGTHWYHSHTALQRGDGLFGALVVLPVEEDKNLPKFAKDFIVMFHDWNQLTSVVDYYSGDHGFEKYLRNGFDSDTCSRYPRATVINGRGFNQSEVNTEDPKVVTTFKVTQGNYYRLRFLNSGIYTPYLVEVEQHKMMVIALDGRPVKPYRTVGLVVNVGERYDVYTTTDQKKDKYRITFSEFKDGSVQGYAILQYNGRVYDPNSLSTFKRHTCNESEPCRVVNCPHKKSKIYNCSSIAELRSSDQVDTLTADDIEEHFLVFGFTESINGGYKASINAIHFVVPSKPPQVYRKVDFDRPCNQTECDKRPCQCTHMIKVTKGKVIQMVFAATHTEGHPIHMHGHDFQVIKVVYGDESGKINNVTKVNSDIDCRSNTSRCTKPTWSNSSWLGGNVPGINLHNPPLKDTVFVPSSGYVVLRFRADNPGWWMLHCHIEDHLAEGMGLIMQEGEETDMAAPPKGFPTCGSFRYDQETTTDANQDTQLTNRGSLGTIQGRMTSMVAMAGTFLLLLFL